MQANIVALFAVIMSIPIPLLMPLLVDEVLLAQPGVLVGAISSVFQQSWHGPTLFVMATLLITVVLRFGMLGFGVWQLKLFALISKDVSYRIRRALLDKLQHVSMEQYETMGSGTVSSHFVTDINAIDQFIGEGISKFLIAVLSLVGISIVLVLMHWQLALFILIMNPVVIYFTVALGKKVKQLKNNENRAFELFQQSLNETLDAIQEIRASNRQAYYIGGVIEKAKEIKKHSARFSWRSDAANRFSFGVFLLGFDVFRAIAMLMVVFSDLSIGEMMAVFGYLWFMMSPVQEVLNVQYAYFAAKAALKRINALAALEKEPVFQTVKNPFSDKHTVSLRVENLCFSYRMNQADTEEWVLKNVNFSIKAGEKVALVGASGGGKSTLVQLILGLYHAQEGEVFFDDVPVSLIGLEIVRENVSTVLQNPAMFNDTVRMNLSLGRDCSEQQLFKALEVAQLRDTIESMPDGLDSIIGRQGIRLSGGQRQRMAIARMILTQPKIVILDEATSALDAQTEASLHEALSDFLKNRTTLIVAHRLSAVRQADRVYVFDDGQIMEEGVHEELINNNGLYQRLYSKQV